MDLFICMARDSTHNTRRTNLNMPKDQTDSIAEAKGKAAIHPHKRKCQFCSDFFEDSDFPRHHAACQKRQHLDEKIKNSNKPASIIPEEENVFKPGKKSNRQRRTK